MREDRWLPYTAVALVAAALYLQTLRFDYVFDDKPLIVIDAFLTEPWSPVRAFHREFRYGTPFVGYYRPLVIASLTLSGRILGWGPATANAGVPLARSPFVVSLIHSGDLAEALALLKRSLERDPATHEWIRKMTDFDGNRGTPGFDQLVAR